jgi:L-serine dehydratase
MNASIFNDVIGPVMRGPSSSHTAASWRIASLCRGILNEPVQSALIDFDRNGAWAGNYIEQGTLMGINAGLLGLDITDDRMKDTEAVARAMGIEICYEVNSFPTSHTNTVRLTLTGSHGKTMQCVAISTGGGAFEIQQVDAVPVRIRGDYFELLLMAAVEADNIAQLFPGSARITQASNEGRHIVNIKSPLPFTPESIARLTDQFGADNVAMLHPILPVVSGNQGELPFSDLASLLHYAAAAQKDLGLLGLMYEQSRSGLPEGDLNEKMAGIVAIIEHSIATGLNGTDYRDRILGPQAQLLQGAAKAGKILNNSLVINTIANVTAIMEAKSGMEVVVANPTAGSCGTVGGVLKAVGDEVNAGRAEMNRAYFAAGLIGVYFAEGPGFSAEEHGCQVECGAAAGMAAAGIVQLLGGTAKQAVDAASMAIQNMIGLVCDPVADRVEVPCLGKNVSAAMNALSSATMATAGFDAVIPLEQVIETVGRVSAGMPSCVKCTGTGGLAITPASVLIKEMLKNKS